MMNNSTSIEFDIEMKTKDVFDYYIYLMKQRKSFRYLFVPLYFILLILIIATSFYMGGVMHNLRTLILTLIIPPFLVAFRWYEAKRQLKYNPSLAQKHRYTVSEDGFSVKGENFDSKCGWELLKKVSTTPKYIYLWHSDKMANIIPRRCLSDQQFADLRKLIPENKWTTK